MPTRRQTAEQKQFRPDAFASSAEYDRGLLGNLVAARCQKLNDPAEITLIWWLQQVSWRVGGMEKFATEFLEANRSRIGTKSMHKFGMMAGQVYNAQQVHAVRAEMGREEQYPLFGERTVRLWDLSIKAEMETRDRELQFPTSYPMESFLNECWMSIGELTEILQKAVIDPEADSLKAGHWKFPAMWDALSERRQQEVDAAKGSIVETEITRTVAEELDFALHSRSFILIEGREGVGKTEAAKAWCAQHPGQAVYVRLESGTDESTLYRSIARAIGTACSYGRKATEMKLRIQDALQPGQIMLVLDEAHFLWPQSDRSARSAPKRVDWLRTALVDFSVPVALISTPQYFAKACDKFLKGGWNANQIERRLQRPVLLPDSISAEEMKQVAKHYFPHASDADITRVAVTALGELGFLTVIMHLRKRVDFLAGKSPNQTKAACLEIALRDYPAASASAPAPGADTNPAGAVQTSGRTAAMHAPARSTAPVSLSRIHRDEAQLTVS